MRVIERLAIVIVATFSITLMLLWLIVSRSAYLLNFEVIDYDTFGWDLIIGFWITTGCLASLISIFFVSRLFERLEHRQVAWSFALYGCAISAHFCGRALIHDGDLAEYFYFLDLAAILGLFLSLWLSSRIFLFYPNPLTVDMIHQATNPPFSWVTLASGVTPKNRLVFFNLTQFFLSKSATAVFCVVISFWFLRSNEIGWLQEPRLEILGTGALAAYLASFIGAQALLVGYQSNLATEAEQQLLKWVVVAYFISLVFSILFAMPAVLIFDESSILLTYFFSAYGLFILIVFPVFSVLMIAFLSGGNSNPFTLLRRGSVLGVMWVIFAGLFVLISEFLEQIATDQFQLPGEVAALGAAAVTSMVYSRVRDLVEPWLKRLFDETPAITD